MANRQVNDLQRALLERMADGREPVTSIESRLAVTVYALRDRGLARLVKHRGQWVAEVTDAGLHYLRHGHYPGSDGHRRDSPAKSAGEEGAEADRQSGSRIDAWELLRRVTEAGGTLRISDPDVVTRAAWRSAIHRVLRGAQTPDGFALRHRGRDRGDLVICLVPGGSRSEPSRSTVAIPERLGRVHPAVAALRAAPAHLMVSRSVRSRALRLLQAVAAEATLRGHLVTHPAEPRDAVLVVVVHERAYPLALRELSIRTVHEPTLAEIAEKQRRPWTRIPDYDYAPSGRLELSLPRRYDGRPCTFGDRQRWQLDDRLLHLPAEIEARAAIDERRQLERDAEHQQRQQAHRLALRQAYERLVEHERAESLLRQVTDWRHARDIRKLCGAVRAARNCPPTLDSEEQAWLAWADAYADSLDPTGQPFLAPRKPEPDGRNLLPFLAGWSPYLDGHTPPGVVIGEQ